MTPQEFDSWAYQKVKVYLDETPFTPEEQRGVGRVEALVAGIEANRPVMAKETGTPQSRQLAELVALLRDHPGAGLIHEPTNWPDALDVVKAHLDNRKNDQDFRTALIDKLERFLPAGEWIEDWMLLNLLHELIQHADKNART